MPIDDLLFDFRSAHRQRDRAAPRAGDDGALHFDTDRFAALLTERSFGIAAWQPAWLAIAPAVGIASWMFDGIFIGATQTKAMRNSVAISAAIYAAALVVLLPAFGNHGLWMGLMVLNAARGLTLAVRYPALERAVEA